jgi:hypothetical protein
VSVLNRPFRILPRSMSATDGAGDCGRQLVEVVEGLRVVGQDLVAQRLVGSELRK